MTMTKWLAMVTGTALMIGCAMQQASAVDRYKADLSGASEVPAVTSPAKGTLTGTYDPATKVFVYKLEFTGVAEPTAAHFHGPAAAGANAGVALPIGAGAPTSGAEGRATLTDAQAADLAAGRWYANLHSKAHGSGELRGQVMKQ